MRNDALHEAFRTTRSPRHPECRTMSAGFSLFALPFAVFFVLPFAVWMASLAVWLWHDARLSPGVAEIVPDERLLRAIGAAPAAES